MIIKMVPSMDVVRPRDLGIDETSREAVIVADNKI